MSRYIDADWLLNFFEPYPNDYQTPLGSLRACVDDAPSIDIELKRGEWIEWVDCEGEVFWKCSACGQVSEASVAGILYKFCPFCGADMRGADDEMQ